MGVGLSEFRAAIGAFAWIAIKAGPRWKNKSKQKRSSRTPKSQSEGKESKIRAWSQGDPVRGRCLSLKVLRTCNRTKSFGQRSNSWTPTENTKTKPVHRRRSVSPVRRAPDVTRDSFKNSCVACKTKMFDQRRQRGRVSHRREEECMGASCKLNVRDMKAKKSDISMTYPQIFALFTVTGCFLLEQAIFTVVQMLLVRSGIETNPGPKSSNNPLCCMAYQHFKRVNNTIEKTQNDFQSKVNCDTLTKKVIEIEETGE